MDKPWLFKKGNKLRKGKIPWNKNKKGIIGTNKGKKCPWAGKNGFKKGGIPWNKGISCSESTKNKIGLGNKGKMRSEEFKEKMSKRFSGENNNFWIDGRTPINKRIRHSREYELWRKVVFERDKYTCIWCGQHGGQLHADHIKPFALFPELRFAIDNGRTLCINCHKKTKTYLRNFKKNVTPN